MALVALKRISLGPDTFEPGDRIPAEVQLALPRGRVEALRSQNYVEERDDMQRVAEEIQAALEAVRESLTTTAEQVEALAERVAALEAQPAKPKTQRKPKEASA